ncbi:hypothetical protein JB92DRAFT_3208558, partial [Gautieria morchelliformis]
LTHATLASMLPVPQRYYVPRRIKESYRPCLEVVCLWAIGNKPEHCQDDPGARRDQNETSEAQIKPAFGQAKVCHSMVKLVEKARLVFDILAKLLSEKSFLFINRLASHL